MIQTSYIQQQSSQWASLRTISLVTSTLLFWKKEFTDSIFYSWLWTAPHPSTLFPATCHYCNISRSHVQTPKLLCGNKMPTRCNRDFYCRSYCLLNMFRASLCPSSGAQEYYTVVAACGISGCGFSSSWSGVDLRVMCPVCRMLQHPANRTHKNLCCI